MSEENKAIARKDEIVDPDALGNLRASVTEEHPEAKLLDTFKRFVSETRAAFPDMHITVEDLISKGDKVAARLTMRGTHFGEFQGIAPTGKRVHVSPIDIFRVSDGEIVEHWGHVDDPSAVLRPPERS